MGDKVLIKTNVQVINTHRLRRQTEYLLFIILIDIEIILFVMIVRRPEVIIEVMIVKVVEIFGYCLKYSFESN